MGASASTGNDVPRRKRLAKARAAAVVTARLEQADNSALWTAEGWIESLGVHKIVAGALSKQLKGAKSELRQFRELAAHNDGEQELVRLLEEGNLLKELAVMIWAELPQLSARTHVVAPPPKPSKPPAEQESEGGALPEEAERALPGKFEGATFELSFAGLSTYFSGLEGIVGAPSKRVEQGMRREHTEGYDADNIFVTGNYHVRTTSAVEWFFSHCPESLPPEAHEALTLLLEDAPAAHSSQPSKPSGGGSGAEPTHAAAGAAGGSGSPPKPAAAKPVGKGGKVKLAPLKQKGPNWPREEPATLAVAGGKPRVPLPRSHFKPKCDEINRRLSDLKQDHVQEVEVLGARLYTGPMYVKYNAVSRACRLEARASERRHSHAPPPTTTTLPVHTARYPTASPRVHWQVLRGIQLPFFRRAFISLCCSASVARQFEAGQVQFEQVCHWSA